MVRRARPPRRGRRAPVRGCGRGAAGPGRARRAGRGRGRRRAARGPAGAADRDADADVGRGRAPGPCGGRARSRERVKVAVVGGTGDFGLALAERLVQAGDDVVIGSRDAARAAEAAAQVGARGAVNEEAVGDVELVVLATKAEAALATAEALSDAIDGR